MQRLMVVMVLLASMLSAASARGFDTGGRLLPVLDSLIDHRATLRHDYRLRLDSMAQSLRTLGGKARNSAAVRLFDARLSFEPDSACLLADVMQRTDAGHALQWQMRKANALNAMGMYLEALACIDSTASCPDTLRSFRFSTLRTIYGALAEYASTDAHRRQYLRLTALYRDSIILTTSNMTDRIVVSADRLRAMGHHAQAVDTLMQLYRPDEHTRLQAIVTYCLSEAYDGMGQADKAAEMLARSAICDLLTGVREYISLWKLAEALYARGDTRRAYNYLKCSLQDATQSKARLRAYTIGSIYPIIEKSYLEMESAQRERQRIFLLVISFLTLALAVALVCISRQIAGLKAVRRRLSEANDQLHRANDRLSQTNRIKEEYIGRYLEQCSYYISEIEKCRRIIGKTRNDTDIRPDDGYLKTFYSDFDRAFLKIFPTFIDDFNRLVEPAHRFELREWTLNTELRIFALIRLGIDRSEQIARLLQYSNSTIYNYRTKMRNCALGPRETFEQRVRAIGMPERQM